MQLTSRSRTNRHRSAFSLIELLLAVTIIGIIAAIVVPRISTSSERAKDRVCRHHITQINSAIERYYIENGEFPDEDLILLNVPEYFPEGLPVCPITGAAYTAPTADGRVEHDPDAEH